ncbi:MAG: hypothetical protein AAF429_09455 [Pseudomonadota bacterium]
MVNACLPCQYRVGFAAVTRRYTVGGIVGAFGVTKSVNVANASVGLTLIALASILPSIANSNSNLIDKSKCSHNLSIHDNLCQVTHFFQCESHEGTELIANRVFEDGIIIFEGFGDAYHFNQREYWYLDDGNWWLSENNQRNQYSVEHSEENEIIESSNKEFKLISDLYEGEVMTVTRTAARIVNPAKSSAFFGYEAQSYDYVEMEEMSWDDTQFYKARHLASGDYVPELKLYLWRSHEFKNLIDKTDETSERDFIALLKPDHPDFKATEVGGVCRFNS